MPLSVTTKAPSAGEKTCSGVDRLLAEPPSPADSRTESPAPPLSPGPNSGQPPPLAQPLQTQAAPGVGGILSTVSNFSVINYVGKIQKQSSYKSSTGRCRTPYDRSSSYRAGSAVVCRITEPPMDDTTNSSTFSSLEYGCSSGGGGSSSSSSSTTSSNHSTGIGCDTSPECSDQLDSIDTTEDGSTSGPRLRSRRSMSVSSSGCSSSMNDRNFDFSPLGSIISCRCNSYSMSDFDDDGFREDSSVSSAHGGGALSGSRSYQSHHPLHHHHQNVPHHPRNHKGLFDIALKTVKLIRRNQELQVRLAQLQEETSAFIDSVMANPENESLRSHFYSSKRIPTLPLTVQK
ncbi:location of vulva defective 1 isoform X1 [Anopheles gambiae]|uniref:location of vulva defective 1 isoform X1 n=1 Tax=Anopheles gambiae TaxID=7165 RepID=UPI002AC8AD5F|nr:location of vulva defective 1 isoform X1 [Anopheles gambiae]